MEDKYKQYQKHKEETIKEHKKRAEWHQPELPFYGTTEEDFYIHVSKKAIPKALTDEEVEDLFWKHLVHIGWKFHTSTEYTDTLVLQCQKCEKILHQVFISAIGLVNPLSSLKNPEVLKTHECEALPEAEEE